MNNPAWEQIESEFTCEHADVRLVRFTKSNATEEFRRQCQRCGKTVEVARKANLSAEEMRTTPPYDPGLAARWWQQRSARFDELRQEQREAENSAWWQRYAAYMASPEWAARRLRVLGRDNRLCQACLKRPAEHVHHLSYKHFGAEPLFELTSICRVCHEALHPQNQGSSYHQ